MLDSAFSLDLVRITEAAACAAALHVGRGDEHAAEEAAARAMRAALAALPLSVTVIVGEGEPDDVPVLFTGERLGAGGAELEVALDALEGTTLAAKALPNAIAVMALAARGTLLPMPDSYMQKLAVGPGYPAGLLDIDAPAGEIIRCLARARGVSPAEITACILDRPRHSALIGEVRAAGAAVRLIGDGDVAAVLATTDPASGIDVYMGIGGAPEGLLGAVAILCANGQMQARFVPRNEADRGRLERAGLDPKHIYRASDLVRGDALFVATGVTDGSLLDGVRRQREMLTTDSLVLRASTGTLSRIRSRQRSLHAG